MTRTRQEEVLYQAFPWVLGVIVFFASFLTPLQTPWEVASRNYALFIGHGFSIVVLALLGGVSTVMANRRIWPVCVVAVVGWLGYSMWPPMLVASFYAALRWKTRWRAVYMAVALLLVVVPIAVGATAGALYAVRFAATIIPLVIMPYTAGLWVRTRRRLIDELRARNDTLAAQVRAEERARIAREMHDVVAHRVALIVLHAGGLELRAPDEYTAQEAELIRTTGREALNELRHLLGVLRDSQEAPPPRPLLPYIDKLVEETRQTGVTVELRVEGELANLSNALERSVYRLVQEALTNVVKHAPGAPINVLLRKSSGWLEVTVRNGPGTSLNAEQQHTKKRLAEQIPSGGMGLIGLRERVDLLGGEFEAGPLPDGGFEVSARLPV